MKTLISIALFAAAVAGTAMADRVNVASDADVATSVERLTKAVEMAGARVFTTVDFAAGSASVGESLRPTTVVIFGSPKIGAKALQQGQTMALNLPLRILFFEDANGQTWAIYDDPTAVAPSHGLTADHPAVLAMKGALEKFSAAATGE
ncbi:MULTISPECIES: DUF302 domain-containing protein [Mameliella]|uniref:CrcB family protein n=1 Tax=Mameliella alba TaxID=561184 RepID=A0A0B3RHF1_9RHOB|nr:MULTISPECIES: DUF302 domain-containing protein [Mameliella]KHQ50725.1 CrcB family protein [Mameliella alba]MDD9730550.1 DUF302 domain-containing protein [Mameliella sp. AT18]ODM48061.1 hypothetical protein A9320_20215 [Ruegeria sp. PBVC088]